jgi:hypothetical protein
VKDFGGFLVGLAVGVPFTLVIEAMIKGGFRALLDRFKKWLRSGPASEAAHPLLLSREEDSLIRLTNYGVLTYRDVKLSTRPAAIGTFPEGTMEVRVPNLKPGHSFAFPADQLGLTDAGDDDSTIKIRSALDWNGEIRLEFTFTNPSAVRSLFKRKIEWWEYIHPRYIPVSDVLQSWLLHDVKSKIEPGQGVVPPNMERQIMNLTDEDARTALNAPRDYEFKYLRRLLGS